MLNACTCQCTFCSQGEVAKHDNCVAHTKMYKGVTKLWEDCACPKGDFEEWHKLDCLMGECAKCGVGKLAICPNECSAHLSWPMAWRCFEQETIVVTDEGGPKKRIKEAFKETIVLLS